MAGEDTESVGGISIEASVDDSRVDSELNALLGKLRQEAERLSAALTIHPQIGSLNAQQVQQQTRQQRQQPQSVSFSGASAPTTRFTGAGAVDPRLAAINKELAKTGEIMHELGGDIFPLVQQSTQATRAASQAATQIGQMSTAVSPTVDDSELKAGLSELVAEVKAVFAEISKSAVIVPTISDEAVAGGGGGGGSRASRRKALRDQGIGTEVNARAIRTYDPDVYEEQEARRIAAAQRGTNAAARAAGPAVAVRTSGANAAESQFIAALLGAQDENTQALHNLSEEAQAAQRQAPTGPFRGVQQGLGLALTPREEASRRAELDARLARQTSRLGEDARAGRAVNANGGPSGTGGGGGGGGRGRAVEVDDIDRQRRAEQQLAVAESQRLTAARTARTFASGLGGFFLGQTREQTEATINLRRREQELTVARRRLNDPSITSNARAYRHAQEEVAVAEGKVASALEDVQKFTGGISAARTLAAVTVAGAAFGLGLKAIDIGIAAVGKSLEQTFAEATGFSDITQKITTDLAQQTRQAQGNAQAVTAQALAYTGLSAEAAKVIQPLVKQRTETVAGTQALGDLVDNFQAFQRIGRENAGGPDRVLTAETGGPGGLGIFGQHSAEQELRRLFSGLPQAGLRPGSVLTPGYVNRVTGPERATPQFIEQTLAETASAVNVLNAQLDRGGEKVLRFGSRVELGADEFNRSLAAIREAGFGEFARELERAGVGIRGLEDLGDFQQLLKSLTVGNLTPDVDLLKQQFARQTASILAAAERQQQFSLGTQLPAEAALQHIAAPLPPIGTGIVAANADEQERIVAGQQKSIELQENLNSQYEAGKQVLIDTYKVPPSLIKQVTAIGKDIASIGAGIANQQALHQVHQYNYQLHIARRTLSDIGGLTGKNFGAGQSYLGQLERENLALSRQGQILQFNLAQRQINFQVAVAGFQAPGVTPEERQANVKQAEIEADFAQKQLNIQREMFGNQVQIVDISNLRQGADLAAQIGLMLEGRQLTIDTALAQEQLARLQAQQTILVGQVGTYLTKTNSLAAAAFSQIQQLEAAAGRAMYSTAYSVLDSFGIVLNGLSSQLGGLNQMGGRSGGQSPDERGNATGYVGLTSGKTMTGVGWMGEANQEAYAILRNPKPLMGLGGGGGISITFGDIYVRDDADISKIAQAVMQAMGTRAALTGLRGTN